MRMCLLCLQLHVKEWKSGEICERRLCWRGNFKWDACQRLQYTRWPRKALCWQQEQWETHNCLQVDLLETCTTLGGGFCKLPIPTKQDTDSQIQCVTVICFCNAMLAVASRKNVNIGCRFWTIYYMELPSGRSNEAAPTSQSKLAAWLCPRTLHFNEADGKRQLPGRVLQAEACQRKVEHSVN